MSSIGGYKPGDKVGLGVVIDPAKVVAGDEIKPVNVDINLDGKYDKTFDDQIMVKLPPKGVKMVNLDGLANESLKTSNTLKGVLSSAAAGAGAGAIVGIISGLPFVSKTAVDAGLQLGLPAGVTGGFGLVVGGPLAGSGAVKPALIITGAVAAITSATVFKNPTAIALVGIGSAIGAVAGAGVQIFQNTQEINRAMEKARADMIPDMVKPKIILNVSE